MAKVLIIDDDASVTKMLSDMIENMKHEAVGVYTLKDGLLHATSGLFDAIFLDIRLPDGNGLDILQKIRRVESKPEVIIITGEDDPQSAEIAINNGAWDYIQKPLSPKKLILPLNRVLQYRDELKKVRKPKVALKFDGVSGSSSEMQKCLDLLADFSNSDANVLITGETGTGKELFARTIHANSRYAGNNFVVVDCGSLPETLVESMLLGYEKGAFTGADKSHIGLIKEADGGTLFLDEIGELPINVQKSFLRILEQKMFRPLGSSKDVISNFRLIAATNRNLELMVKAGKFREDLLFRIQSLTIEIPPLRNRFRDIKTLAIYYIGKLCERYQTEIKGSTPEFFDILTNYEWPGNVRELVNTIEVVLTNARFEPTLYPRHLPNNIRIQAVQASKTKDETKKDVPLLRDFPMQTLPPLQEARESMLQKWEKQYIEDLLLISKGDIKDACKISALSRSHLYHLFQKHNIKNL